MVLKRNASSFPVMLMVCKQWRAGLAGARRPRDGRPRRAVAANSRVSRIATVPTPRPRHRALSPSGRECSRAVTPVTSQCSDRVMLCYVAGREAGLVLCVIRVVRECVGGRALVGACMVARAGALGLGA